MYVCVDSLETVQGTLDQVTIASSGHSLQNRNCSSAGEEPRPQKTVKLQQSKHAIGGKPKK